MQPLSKSYKIDSIDHITSLISMRKTFLSNHPRITQIYFVDKKIIIMLVLGCLSTFKYLKASDLLIVFS